MATIERKIDALGGAHTDKAYGEGHDDALTAAMIIGADADAQIDELIDWIEDFLYGRHHNLAEWATSARETINRMRAERAR